MNKQANKRNEDYGYLSLDRIITQFIWVKRAQGVSQRTEDDYYYHIRLFFDRTGTSLESYEGLKQAVIRYFAESRKLSPYTHNTRRKTLNTFFNWAVEEKIIPINPISSIPISKMKESFEPKAIDTDTAQKLLGLCNRTDFCGVRDYALILLTLDNGIRPSEALKLTRDMFDFRSKCVNVPAEIAKDKEARILPMSKQTIAAVKEVILAHHPGWDINTPVFCSHRGEKLNEKSWARIMRIKYSPYLDKPVTPYDLRTLLVLCH